MYPTHSILPYTYLLLNMKCVPYQNCSDLILEKNCSSDREKLLKLEAEGREFAKISRLLEQFLKQFKVGTIFGDSLLFYLFLEVSQT